MQMHAAIVTVLLQANMALAVEPVSAPAGQAVGSATPLSTGPFEQLQRPRLNPIDAYRGTTVPPPSMANSVRLSTLVNGP